ncbi:MAG: hypothetical protein KC503_11130 [Myxococcales bacterium]|nr:hypothetical protein [Myxococcales bacterium]
MRQLRILVSISLFLALAVTVAVSHANRIKPGWPEPHPDAGPCRCTEKGCYDGKLDVRPDPSTHVQVCKFRRFAPASFYLKPGTYTVTLTHMRCKKKKHKFKVKIMAKKTTKLRPRVTCN